MITIMIYDFQVGHTDEYRERQLLRSWRHVQRVGGRERERLGLQR